MYLLGFSATPMLTACYGMPYSEDEIDPTPFDDISGVVYEHDTMKPIPGIKVSVPTYDISTTTDSEGRFYIDHFFSSSVRASFEDIDGAENGEFYSNAYIVTSENHHNQNAVLREKE